MKYIRSDALMRLLRVSLHAGYLDSNDDVSSPVSVKRYCQSLGPCHRCRMKMPCCYSF